MAAPALMQPQHAPGAVGGPSSYQAQVGPTSTSSNIGTSSQQASSQNQATASSVSGSYIPDYLESPILRSIAQQAQGMAAPIYQWGMDQFNNNQGRINEMMRNALTYSSPQRVAQEMGQAQAGVMQGAEAGRQNTIRDLQSFGIDPSSGRYAALDNASRVMAGAQAAGAGNVQRAATEATGYGMQKDAQQMSLANVATGYGAANAANQFLRTASQLKFPPLGQTSSSQSQSTGSSQQTGSSMQSGTSTSGGGGSTGFGYAPQPPSYSQILQAGTAQSQVARQNTPTQTMPHVAAGGPIWRGMGMASGGPPRDDATTGGFVSQDMSPTAGARVDDVPAQLNAGEFVIPNDVAAWKGQEFFYKLMAQARALRAKAGSEGGQQEQPMTGYGANSYA